MRIWKMSVAIFYVPKLIGAKHRTIVQRKLLLKETLTIYLKDGFTVIADSVNFNYTEESWALAYQKIGLV